MMNTCLNSISINISILIEDLPRLAGFHRQTGFSLPEVMISLLLVSLGANALVSHMASSRMQEANNARFATALRLTAELSDWARQGGLSVFASGRQNPFDLIEGAVAVPACFNKSCGAEAAALFYLHHWRRRLFLKIPNARIVVCQDDSLIGSASHHWPCHSNGSSLKARVIKIGWPQGRDDKEFPPRLALGLG